MSEQNQDVNAQLRDVVNQLGEQIAQERMLNLLTQLQSKQAPAAPAQPPAPTMQSIVTEELAAVEREEQAAQAAPAPQPTGLTEERLLEILDQREQARAEAAQKQAEAEAAEQRRIDAAADQLAVKMQAVQPSTPSATPSTIDELRAAVREEVRSQRQVIPPLRGQAWEEGRPEWMDDDSVYEGLKSLYGEDYFTRKRYKD